MNRTDTEHEQDRYIDRQTDATERITTAAVAVRSYYISLNCHPEDRIVFSHSKSCCLLATEHTIV